LGLVIHPTPINQNQGWQQLVTPLIAKQLRVIPYPMWYSVVPPFIPVDLNMYSMYYYGIKRPGPLILDEGRDMKTILPK
jgi:hypothetical protein